MSSANILFYSNNCEPSQHLISLMQSENLIRFFHLICTDNNPKIPSQINVTPTLILHGIPTPYKAGEAFVWLSKMKQWKIRMMMQQASVAQQQYLQSMNKNMGQNESNVLEFSQTEMAGMSDIFAYLQNEGAMPHSYFTCNNMGQENIFTPPLEDGQYKINPNGKYKIDSKKQTELHNKLIMERKQQDDAFRQQIETFRNQYGQK